MAKHKHNKMKPGQLDCEEIGCIPKMSQSELESSEGFWLQYEKETGAKITRFTIKLSDSRIDYAEWVDGSKTKWQKQLLKSSELARKEFDQLLALKKSAGFKYTGYKW